MGAREIVLPLAHRFFPITGPGGLAGFVMSRLLRADASNMVHVIRYPDVADVWKRDDDFSVRGYDERMTETTGPFILGMNDLERYAPESKLLNGVVRREDRELVQRLVAEETERAVGRARSAGAIDVVQDLANPVCIRFAQRYYGLEGPDPDRLLELFQIASWYIFSFWKDDVMRLNGVKAAEELRSILDGIVARRRAAGEIGDGDVMGRLLGMPEPFADGDRGIARSIAGLASGTLNAPIGLLANTVDKLLGLDGPEKRRAHELARSAVLGSKEDEREFGKFVDEAERFGVFPSVLYRRAERDAVLAEGTAREKRIPKGSTVVVWPSLAAFDAEVFERPFDFVPGRPGSLYMGFGYGRHRCLGEHIGQVLVHEMSRALFSLPGLRRAPGKAGTLQHRPLQEANFPVSFRLEFDKIS